jgi:hypothetical protein
MLISSFELLLKPQFPKDAPIPTTQGVPDIKQLSRTVIQAYFLTISNVNTFDVTVSLEFTIKFPTDTVPEVPKSFKDLIDALDITGKNLFNTQLVPEIVPGSDKARLTFTIPSNTTSLLVLQPDFISKPQLLNDANFEARGYAEISVISLSGSETATLLVTPQLRGTFFKDLAAKDFPNIGLDQIAYTLPVRNGGVFEFSNS